jgi:hypothetical protein
VDNSVDNMGARRLIAYAMGPEVKLMIFSPEQKIHIFH